MNALEKLHALLSPANEGLVIELHKRIAAFPLVREKIIPFSVASFRIFLTSFYYGMAYAAKKYHDSTPAQINWCSEISVNDVLHDNLLLYRKGDNQNTDEILMTYFHIASHSAAIEIGEMAINDHLPEGFIAKAIDVVKLNAIEECHHCHWIKTHKFQKINTITDRDHPIEKAIFKVMRIAIDDLGIINHASR